MKRFFSAILIIAAVATSSMTVGLLAPSGAHASVSLTAIERQVLDCVNRERVRHGLARVRAQADLTRAARAHSRDMAHQSYFAHASAAGQTYVQRVIDCGYERTGWSRWTVGENIYSARVGTLLATAQVVVTRWMGSPEHRRVLLASVFRDAGIGVHEAGGTKYFTLDLGRRVR